MQTTLAIVSCGSPAEAARSLGVSITTVYRHIDAFEESIGYSIFERHRDGWILCNEAKVLLATGRKIERLFKDAESEIRSVSKELGGKLLIAASDDFATYYIASHLSQFCETYKNIQPDLIVSNSFSDLENGEADVAIRPDMNPGDRLVGHRIGRMRYAFYASYDYVQQYGSASSLPNLSEHRICGFGAGLKHYTAAKWMNKNLSPETIVARFGSTTAMAQAVSGGVGIGLLPCFVGDSLPSVKCLFKIKEGSIPIDIWLVTGASGRKRHKVQAFFKYFSAVMKADKSLFLGTRKPQ